LNVSLNVFSVKTLKKDILKLHVAKASTSSLSRLQYLNVVGWSKPEAHVHLKQERHKAMGICCEASEPRCITGLGQRGVWLGKTASD